MHFSRSRLSTSIFFILKVLKKSNLNSSWSKNRSTSTSCRYTYTSHRSDAMLYESNYFSINHRLLNCRICLLNMLNAERHVCPSNSDAFFKRLTSSLKLLISAFLDLSGLYCFSGYGTQLTDLFKRHNIDILMLLICKLIFLCLLICQEFFLQL